MRRALSAPGSWRIARRRSHVELQACCRSECAIDEVERHHHASGRPRGRYRKRHVTTRGRDKRLAWRQDDRGRPALQRDGTRLRTHRELKGRREIVERHELAPLEDCDWKRPASFGGEQRQRGDVALSDDARREQQQEDDGGAAGRERVEQERQSARQQGSLGRLYQLGAWGLLLGSRAPQSEANVRPDSQGPRPDPYRCGFRSFR
jgi:hypothetical protein